MNNKTTVIFFAAAILFSAAVYARYIKIDDPAEAQQKTNLMPSVTAAKRQGIGVRSEGNASSASVSSVNNKSGKGAGGGGGNHGDGAGGDSGGGSGLGSVCNGEGNWFYTDCGSVLKGSSPDGANDTLQTFIDKNSAALKALDSLNPWGNYSTMFTVYRIYRGGVIAPFSMSVTEWNKSCTDHASTSTSFTSDKSEEIYANAAAGFKNAWNAIAWGLMRIQSAKGGWPPHACVKGEVSMFAGRRDIDEDDVWVFRCCPNKPCKDIGKTKFNFKTGECE